MSNLEKFKEQARKFELKGQWPKAIEQLVKAVEAFEASPEDDAELGLYNRVGDLYQKTGDTQNAIVYYERAVDKYAEGGLHNNAIALANKLLRLAPGRSQVYLKLGMLFAKKGFGTEAKQNLLEYADRMQKAGQLEEAFKALKKFAEMTPGNDEMWAVLAQQARAAAKTPEATEQVDKLLGEFEAKDKVASQRKSRMSRSQVTGEDLPPEPKAKRDLVFLDINEPTPAARRSAAQKAPVEPPPPEPEIPALEIESTALAEPAPAPDVPLLDVEPTSFGEPAAASAPALEIEATSLGIEPTSLEIEPMMVEQEPTPLTEPPAAPADEFGALELEVAEPVAAGPAEGLPLLDVGAEGPAAGLPLMDVGAEPPAQDLTFMDLGEAAPVEGPPVMDVGAEVPAEAQPSMDVGAGGPTEGLPLMDFGTEAPAESLPLMDLGAGVPAEDVPAMDFGAEPTAAADASGSSLEFLDLGDVTATAPAAEELESRLAANPEDWAAHRLLGEALLERGERDRGLGELDAALEGYDQAGDLEGARAVTEEVIRLDPNSVRYQQRRVEIIYRQGDKPGLVEAYVALADALLRSDDPGKAIAVYQRVLEHDPGNVHAMSALDTLAPPAAAPRAAAPTPAKAPAAAKAPADYVDLGAFLLDEEEGPKDTRMRIEDEEPSGDEQKDFAQMLAAFKKGIEANVGEEDFQSHYDLGVAYKEMGLLDEGIAEFQKALRSSEGRLKGSEALGLCFFEKGQFAVAETIMRRALELPAASESERIGLLYWLGRAQEEQGKGHDALSSYNRVFAVDINFQDVNQRVQALAKSGA